MPQYRYIIFFSILVGILGQLDHFLRNFPNPTSRKWKAKYLDRFIDPDARARVEKTFVQAKFNPVRYYLPAIVISGIVVCIPFFIFPVSRFWGVVSGIILYGLIISKYLSDRSKRKKAKNQRLLGEILVELDQSKNTINPQAGSVVNTIRHEGAITSIPFSIEKHDALELQIEGASYKTLFNSHKQMIHQKIIEPYHILTLRVFQSEHMENFLSLIKNWFYLGSIMRLNGPDTVDDKSHTKEDFLDKMIKDNEELDKALADLQFLPDRKGEYAINAMQCTNATWKEAIQALIDKAHIIVMDLSAISIYNQGITYELAKVVNEIPLKKVVMLMDNTTDEKVLHAMLKKICENITVDSPNVNGNGIVFQLLNTGGAEERKKYESEYAWRKRTAIRVNEMQLMSYLFSVTDKLKV